MNIDRKKIVWRFVKVGQEPRVESVQLAYGRYHPARDRGESKEDRTAAADRLFSFDYRFVFRKQEATR